MMKKYFYIVAAIVLILFVLGSIILTIMVQSDLKKNGVVVQVTILSVNIGGKSSGGFQCLIRNYKGKSFERPSSSSINQGRFSFVGKNFPGIYSPNFNSLKVLITPEDFEKYSIPFPDSLKWVLQ